MEMHIGNLANLNYLWLVAGVIAVAAAAAAANRRAVARFATKNLTPFLFPGSSRRRIVKLAIISAAVAAMVVALADIRWGKTWREVPQKGIEVMFVLDVSRSMLAEDVAPNRLERAKQQIKDMVDEMAGDRVGLVVFAGDVRQKIPLTSHYHDFKQILDEVGPHNVLRGGSKIGDAIQMASDAFLDKTADHKAIVIFTDGEDHESDPAAIAAAVHEAKGIRLFTVGLGDDEQGARVPVQTASRRGFLTHNGEQVWSKMNGEVLKQIALKTDGAYIPAGTKQVDMAGVYRDYVAQVNEQDFETAKIHSYIPRYQWFVGTALLLILADTLLNGNKRRSAMPYRYAVAAPKKSDPKTNSKKSNRQSARTSQHTHAA